VSAKSAYKYLKQREAEEKTLDGFVRDLGKLPPDEARRVLAGLEPDFLRDVLRRMLKGLPEEDRKRVLRAAQRMETKRVPSTDEELHTFLKEECELSIPRNAVCDGHCAPFEFTADVYFERGLADKLAVGNRGSGKTQIMGALHAVNARTKPKYTSCTVGAVEAQATRAYNFFREQMTRERWAKLVQGKINMSKTEIEGGGKVEIVTGTITGVNSPHPVLAHFDEVELFREGVYDEALNMAQAKNGYRAMNVLTSSWKKPRGFVSELIDDVNRAHRDEERAPYQVYRWCVWETTERCEHDCDACPFSDIVKGTWEDDSKRTFEGACKRGSPQEGVGKLKFTDGFVSIEDAIGRFRKLPRRVWESQQESKRPTLEGLIYDVFDEDRHVVERWDPDPSLGPVYVGIDFGGTVAHAANFWQELNVEFEWRGRRMPVGSWVAFDEVHVVNTGNAEFGRAINARIEFWRDEHPGFEVEGFYGDPAAKAAREDFAALPSLGCGDPIRVRFSGHVDVDPRIALVYERMSNDLVYVDQVRCPEWMQEVGGYERNPNTGKPVKEDDHHMDAMGYAFWNVHARSRKGTAREGSPVGARRPRAVTVQDANRRWDPAALGTVPEYHGARSHEDAPSPMVVGVPRLRRDPFG